MSVNCKYGEYSQEVLDLFESLERKNGEVFHLNCARKLVGYAFLLFILTFSIQCNSSFNAIAETVEQVPGTLD